MKNNFSNSIELNIFNDNNRPIEIFKFYTIFLNIYKRELSDEEIDIALNAFYKGVGMKVRNKAFDEIFLGMIDKPVVNNLLFISNIENSKTELKIDNEYTRSALGDNLVGFLNLDFNNFYDFFRFFCTFIFSYMDRLPEKYFNKIFQGIRPNIVYVNTERPLHLVEKQLLIECAEMFYETDKENLIKMQTLFKNFIDYVFNNNKDIKLSKLNNKQRFYIFQNINKEIQTINKDYYCNYSLEFLFFDKRFRQDILEKITYDEGSNPFENESFLIDSLLSYDSKGKKVSPAKIKFETNNIYSYFYIVLYHITLNGTEFIKKCHTCGRYFFSDKNNTLYCDRKYKDELTCKEFGLKHSQKTKQDNEPVYGKYRQIYAKKAMMVKRNPDIPTYKENYEKWKEEASEFMKNIKSGVKTYEEFDEWLEKNSR